MEHTGHATRRSSTRIVPVETPEIPQLPWPQHGDKTIYLFACILQHCRAMAHSSWARTTKTRTFESRAAMS